MVRRGLLFGIMPSRWLRKERRWLRKPDDLSLIPGTHRKSWMLFLGFWALWWNFSGCPKSGSICHQPPLLCCRSSTSINNIKVVYLKCMGSKDGTTSTFTPKKGPLVLSPKTVGDDFAKTTVDWKGLYRSLRRASSGYEKNPWSWCTKTFLSEGFVERQTLLFWWFLFILSCWIPIPFALHSTYTQQTLWCNIGVTFEGYIPFLQ